MPAFNLPPGCSLNDVDPADTWEKVFETITQDCDKASMTDCDCFVAWHLGLAAWKAARKLGGTFSHDGSAAPKPCPVVTQDEIGAYTGLAGELQTSLEEWERMDRELDHAREGLEICDRNEAQERLEWENINAKRAQIIKDMVQRWTA